MMKRVYVCAPLGGNIEENLKKVKIYTAYALRCGTAPVVPHFYAECLDDNDPKTGNSAWRQECRFCGFAMRFGYSEIPSRTG